MPTDCPSYNPDDILCNCMQLKRQEVEVVAKKSKNFRHVVNSTGAGSVCTSCQPLIHEMMGHNLWVDVDIISVQSISHNVKIFVLGSKNKPFANLKAGQYILVQGYINGRWEIRRYTLVSSENYMQYRQIMVQKEPYGLFSTWLHDESITDKHIRISQPKGRGYPALDKKSTLVFIVGGIGITPAISYMNTVLNSKNATRPLHILHSISNSDRYIYKEALEKYALKHPGITLEFHIVSLKGLLQKEDISTLVDKHIDSEFYLCGSPTFNQSISTYLDESNVKKSDIHIDNFTMKIFEELKPNKTYTYIGLFLLLAFMLQEIFSLKIPALETLQADSSYKIYSGLLVLGFIMMQFIRSYNKASKVPHMSANSYNGHKLRAIFAPLIFFAHSTSFGVGYLFFLSLIYFSNFFVGIFNHELITNAKRRVTYYKLWLPIHITLSLLTVAMIALHIYIVSAY